MTDNEWLLADRLGVIRDTIQKYGEENFYLSFSGGKDSTILHHMLDMAMPNNTIPRVFVNTGIEYVDIVKFVRRMAENDPRFEIIAPTQNIKKTLERVGYPFKSKEHSKKVYEFNRYTNAPYLSRYLDGIGKDGKPTMFCCPNILKYQFEERGKYNYSHLCCEEMKKKPARKWMKENGKTITITGMRAEEGGARLGIGCIIAHKGKLVKFHPLIKVDEDFEKWFVERERVELCRLYLPPFNFERTGCKGCPFSITLQETLDTMQKYLPAERQQCEIIWKPVYDEYRRIGYRIKKYDEIKLI